MADQPSGVPPVALLGAGIMGGGMGRSILREPLALRAWNRTVSRAKALEPDGAQIALSPAEAVADAQVIVTMLADADAVPEAMTAAAPALQDGQIWAQVSTVGLAGLERLAGFASDHGLVFVDSPLLRTRPPPAPGAPTGLPGGRSGRTDRLRGRSRCGENYGAAGLRRDRQQDGVAWPGARRRIAAQAGCQQLGAGPDQWSRRGGRARAGPRS